MSTVSYTHLTLPTIVFAKMGKLKGRASLIGIGVSQIGEFSFVLGSLAYSREAISQSQFTGLLLAVVLSIAASTILVRRAPRSI